MNRRRVAVSPLVCLCLSYRVMCGMQSSVRLHRVVVMGDSMVGKTSILARGLQNQFKVSM